MDKQQVLTDLIHFKKPLSVLRKQLMDLPWDSNHRTCMSPDILRGVLSRFLKGDISRAEIVEWANLIECREHIDFIEDEGSIKEMIFILSNHELNEERDLKKVARLFFENNNL